MNGHELSGAKNQDLIFSVIAMKRAAALARLVAIQTGTAIIVSKDDVIIRRTAAELVEASNLAAALNDE